LPLATYVNNADPQQGNAAIALASGLCTIGQSAQFTSAELAACAGIGLTVMPITPLVTEVDAVTITGAPTGGTFTLTFTYAGSTYTTANIAYNATQAVVTAAIQAAQNPQGYTLPSAALTGSGGPLPGTPVSLTFSGIVGPVTGETSTSALTGGASPAVAFTTTTLGTSPPATVVPAGFVWNQIPTYITTASEEGI
jgi:hypothetical protein